MLRAHGYAIVTVVFRFRTSLARVFVVPWTWMRERVSASIEELAAFETDARFYPYPRPARPIATDSQG
jgi:hypothetical protein